MDVGMTSIRLCARCASRMLVEVDLLQQSDPQYSKARCDACGKKGYLVEYICRPKEKENRNGQKT